jgi:hypothetical protein
VTGRCLRHDRMLVGRVRSIIKHGAKLAESGKLDQTLDLVPPARPITCWLAAVSGYWT